jgi:tetratricopeptide (TPR) repeat protein
MMADYYFQHMHDLAKGINFSQMAISLAISDGNSNRHSEGLTELAWIHWQHGDFAAAQEYAQESQRLARMSGLLFGEAIALRLEAMCQQTRDYDASISLCNRARYLLSLCGLSGGHVDRNVMTSQAEVHKLKSEYIEASKIHTQILQEISRDRDPYHRGLALLNVAEIQVIIGIPKNDVQKNIDTAKSIFENMGDHRLMMACDCFQADLNLREGFMEDAKAVFCQSLRASWRMDSDLVGYCLERLADVSKWDTSHCTSSWTTVFLVHSLKAHIRLGIFKALQFLGDIFLVQDDEDTALSLFTIALIGFTQMDVHRSRAECMLRLGDISKRHDSLLRAVELWEMARPLFERSTQVEQVKNIEKRLAGIGTDVLEEYKNKLASMVELNTPVVVGDLSEIEDLEKVDDEA